MTHVKTHHPKQSLLMAKTDLESMLEKGWIGQAKMNGVRAQIHVIDDHPLYNIKAYNRRGSLLTGKMSPDIVDIIRTNFKPGDIFEAEWLRIRQALFIYEMVAKEGELLSSKNYAERYAMLPKIDSLPHVQTLPILDTPEDILAAYNDAETEGVVFKALNTPGFKDTSIIRCRKAELNDFTNGLANRQRDR